MKKNIVRTRIIIFGTVTLITTAIWIGSEIYHGYTQDPITPNYESQIAPFSPRLSVQVLDQLEQKRHLPINFEQPNSQINPLPQTAIPSSPSANINNQPNPITTP